MAFTPGAVMGGIRPGGYAAPGQPGGGSGGLAGALQQQLNALAGGSSGPREMNSGQSPPMVPSGGAKKSGGGAGAGGGTASSSGITQGGAVQALPGATGGPISNTAAPDPNAQWLVNELKNRMTGQGSTQQAMDIAGSQIRDIGEGTSKAIDENMARRGITGSGVQGYEQGKLAQDLQREQAGSATNIALDRQKAIDALALGSGGIFAEPGQLQQGSQALALQQYLGSGDLALRKYLGEGNLDVARQGQNFGQQQALLNTILQLYQ